tara:strand:+ start:1289 stop:1822 length:534 start_codon:yes stop_codon:yes gene_type:complete
MQTITPQELLKRFGEVKGSKIITVVMDTELKLLKRNRDTKEPCPYVGVRKKTRCKVMLGTDYENGVNNTREREGNEGTFEAQKHSWADRTDKPVISTNKAGDKYYANMRVIETYEVEYTSDGNVIDKSDLAAYTSKKKPPQNQGTEKPVIWNMPKIFPSCSIESYVSDGEEVKVVAE